ncbi:COX assembly mitochondrial protein [Monosporozyma servazzii]
MSQQSANITNSSSNIDVSRHNARLPIWALSPQEEAKARKNLKDFTYEKCGQFVKAMADCAQVHGVKVFPACNPQKEQMKECLLFYQIDKKFLDDQRDLIILNKIEEKMKQNKPSTA